MLNMLLKPEEWGLFLNRDDESIPPDVKSGKLDSGDTGRWNGIDDML